MHAEDLVAPNIKVPSRCGGGRGSSTYPLEVGIRPGWWTPSSHRSETHYYCWYLVNKSQAGGPKRTLDASGLEDTENRFSSARRWQTDYSAMRALPVTAPCPIGASAGGVAGNWRRYRRYWTVLLVLLTANTGMESHKESKAQVCSKGRPLDCVRVTWFMEGVLLSSKGDEVYSGVDDNKYQRPQGC